MLITFFFYDNIKKAWTSDLGGGLLSICLAGSKAGKCDGRANGRGTKANRLSFPHSGPASRSVGRDIFGRNSRGGEMYGCKKLKEECKANILRLIAIRFRGH